MSQAQNEICEHVHLLRCAVIPNDHQLARHETKILGFVIHYKVVSGQDFVVPLEFQYHSSKRWETLFAWNLLFQLDGTFVKWIDERRDVLLTFH